MVKGCAITIAEKGWFMGSFWMARLRGWASSTTPLAIIIWVSLRATRRMGGEFIGGMENNTMYTKGNLNRAEGTERGLFGGLMGLNMWVALQKDNRQGMVSSTGQQVKSSMRDIGETDYFMGRGFNILRTDRNLRGNSRRIGFMGKAFSINRRKQSMGYGKITSLFL